LGNVFSVETIGVFGSVSRGEDTAESDIDLFSAFRDGSGAGMFTCMELVSSLEKPLRANG
jgi:predicted nucleotidyltransferase